MNIRRALEDARKKPEHIRVRLAGILALSTTGILSLLWIGVLLPWQLHQGVKDKESNTTTRQAVTPPPLAGLDKPSQQGATAGARTTQTPPSPNTIPITPAPSTVPSPSPTPPTTESPAALPIASPAAETNQVAPPQ